VTPRPTPSPEDFQASLECMVCVCGPIDHLRCCSSKWTSTCDGFAATE